ncbi:MAG: YbaB/EbfC family nucleoid-associated protein [Candidatus Eisenbacteria sp.]|nr:YbaB/EbfC family nucleoid-associated protein [Candidatus Eisenbacteria bacterium]
MKDMSKMLKQLQQAQSRMMEIQEELNARSMEGSAGGGMVKVIANGRHEVLSIQIEPSVVDAEDIEMLEDLVTAAVNDAMSRVDKMISSEMQKMSGSLGMPGLM